MTYRQRIAEHLTRHLGSYVRAFLYAAIAGLNVWAVELGDKAGAELFSVLANRWPALLLSSVIAIAVTLRAQLDQHIGRVKPSQPEQPDPSIPPKTP